MPAQARTSHPWHNFQISHIWAPRLRERKTARQISRRTCHTSATSKPNGNVRRQRESSINSQLKSPHYKRQVCVRFRHISFQTIVFSKSQCWRPTSKTSLRWLAKRRYRTSAVVSQWWNCPTRLSPVFMISPSTRNLKWQSLKIWSTSSKKERLGSSSARSKRQNSKGGGRPKLMLKRTNKHRKTLKRN